MLSVDIEKGQGMNSGYRKRLRYEQSSMYVLPWRWGSYSLELSLYTWMSDVKLILNHHHKQSLNIDNAFYEYSKMLRHEQSPHFDNVVCGYI